jgi:hypothetical protein
MIVQAMRETVLSLYAAEQSVCAAIKTPTSLVSAACGEASSMENR